MNIKLLKKLREETQASVADVRRALEETNGNYEKAREWISKHSLEKAGKKEGRETAAGVIDTYIHHTMVSGATVAVASETDFVSRTQEFKNFAHELAMQISATDPKNTEELLKSPWIRDERKTIGDLLKENIAKFGENIKIVDFKRFDVKKGR